MQGWGQSPVEQLAGNKTTNCIEVMVVQLDAALESKPHPVLFIARHSFVDPAVPIHPPSSILYPPSLILHRPQPLLQLTLKAT